MPPSECRPGLDGRSISRRAVARANLAGTSFRKADLYDALLDEAIFRDTVMPDGTTQP